MLYQLPLCFVRILIVRVSVGSEKLFYISFLEKSLQNTKVDFFFHFVPVHILSLASIINRY